MFENMTSREKTLIVAVASLVPIFLLFFGFIWFMDSYESNESTIDSLSSELEAEESKTRRGMLAALRRNYYRKVSLPAKTNRVRSIYRNWLDDLIIKEAGMTHRGVKFKDNAGALIHERDPIANRVVFTARPTGKLPQLITFLHAFYSADHLHRINKLSIKPIPKTKRGKVPELTQELALELEIETLSMVDASENMETFPVFKREIESVDQYNDTILTRNIFGPANNAPSLEKPRKLQFTIPKEGEDVAGKYVTVQVSAEDADEDDLLSFELEEDPNKPSGITLGNQPRTASVRRISLRVPQQSEPTTIPVSIKVYDDGLPAKEDSLDFKIVFVAPKVEKPKDPPPPEPEPIPIEFAKQTFVRGIVKGGDGRWTVLIVDQLKTQNMQKLSTDDSIEIDGETWKVISVDRKTVTFEVNGERRSFRNGSNLAEPIVL